MRLSTGWTDPFGVFARDLSTLVKERSGAFGAPIRIEGSAVLFDPSSVRWFLQTGSFTKPLVLQRIDGAKVYFWGSAKQRPWVAHGPHNKNFLRGARIGKCGHNGSRASGQIRRWKTPYAAIMAIDMEFPNV